MSQNFYICNRDNRMTKNFVYLTILMTAVVLSIFVFWAIVVDKQTYFGPTSKVLGASPVYKPTPTNPNAVNRIMDLMYQGTFIPGFSLPGPKKNIESVL